MKKLFQKYIQIYLRKIVTIGMMGVLLMGTGILISFIPSKAQAGTIEDTCAQDNAPLSNPYNDCVNAAKAKAGQSTAAAPEAPAEPAPSGGLIQAIGLPVLNSVLVFVGQSIITILSLFLGIAGYVLDYIIKYTITELATHINGITGINVAWRLIRDLCNMSFIFVLVYHGIMMIFGQADARKIIAPIIIAAVLINFSLFFTKIIIDASNVVAVSFYNSIISGNTTGVTIQVAANTNGVSADSGTISGAFMKDLHIAGIFDKGGFDAATLNSNAINVFTSLFGGSLLILIATFCFMAMAVLFGIRYLTFIILLIISPIGYVSSAIPGLKKYSKQYWEALAGQAYFAPIFMVMTWITLTLAGSDGFLTVGSTGSLGTAFSGQAPKADTIGLLLNYAIIIGLMIATMKMAKDTATKGALVSSKVVGQATSFAGGALFGGAGALQRQTVGRYAKSVADDKDLQQRADLGERGARARLWLANKGAKGSFDVRRSFAGEKVQGLTGIDMGKGIPFNPKAGEGGFAATKKAKTDKDRGEIDTTVDKYRKKKEWGTLAKYVYTLKDKDQQYMYEKLSARDRAALDEALDAEATTRGTPSISPTIRGKLPLEEQEKTEKAAREAAKEKRNKEQTDLIEQLVTATTTGTPGPINPTTGVAYTFDELLQGTGRNVFSPKNGRNLSVTALNNPEVIKRLKPQHLADIMANNDDLDDATIRAITHEIEAGVTPATAGAAAIFPPVPPPHPYQEAQYKYINKQAVWDNWHI